MKTDANRDNLSGGPNPLRRRALGFVLLIGVLSLFAGFTATGLFCAVAELLALPFVVAASRSTARSKSSAEAQLPCPT
jgi:hypothetical protein